MIIFLDHNIWDQLYIRNIDLNISFPKELYSLYITTQGRLEKQQTPDTKVGLKNYIDKYCSTKQVNEDFIFGFGNPNLPPEEQRVSGFGSRYSSEQENIIRTELYKKYGYHKKRKPSQILSPQEADIELASRSLCNVVITLDVKTGPLRDAKNMGGKIVFFNLCEIQKLDDIDFIKYIKSEVNKI